MGCVRFIYRKMELRYWLVPGNVKNNRINQLNEKAFVDALRINGADFSSRRRER